MKNIDIKSLIIGALLTSTIFLGVAAKAAKQDAEKWDFTRGFSGGVACTDNGGTIFLTDLKGLHRSKDRGATWETLLKTK